MAISRQFPNIYFYPDGTSTTTEPIDGEIFQLFDKNRVFQSEWIWDGYKLQWFKRSNIILNNGQPVVHLSNREQTDSELLEDFERMLSDGNGWNPSKPKETSCQCGAEKIQSTRHSSWCPKHAND
jgi:hypothetical protein